MKYLASIAALALVGTAVTACTGDNYSGRSQYGYNNSTDRNRDGIPDNRQSVQNNPRADRDGDGVPNARDRAPTNPYYR